MIDAAMIRPGRFDKLLYVELPKEQERLDILQTIVSRRSVPLASDVSLIQISSDSRCEGYSGADLSSLVREASMLAIQEILNTGNDQMMQDNNPYFVKPYHFEHAFSKVHPSVSKSDRNSYDRLNNQFTPNRVRIQQA